MLWHRPICPRPVPIRQTRRIKTKTTGFKIKTLVCPVLRQETDTTHCRYTTSPLASTVQQLTWNCRCSVIINVPACLYYTLIYIWCKSIKWINSTTINSKCYCKHISTAIHIFLSVKVRELLTPFLTRADPGFLAFSPPVRVTNWAVGGRYFLWGWQSLSNLAAKPVYQLTDLPFNKPNPDIWPIGPKIVPPVICITENISNKF